MFSLHTIFTACSNLSQIQAMIWSYSQAFEDAVSMKDAILNKAVLIQRKEISFTDTKGAGKCCWLRSRTPEKDLMLEIELPLD